MILCNIFLSIEFVYIFLLTSILLEIYYINTKKMSSRSINGFKIEGRLNKY